MAVKGAYSGAFERAAVMFAVGQYLYALAVDERRQILASEMPKLHAVQIGRQEAGRATTWPGTPATVGDQKSIAVAGLGGRVVARDSIVSAIQLQNGACAVTLPSPLARLQIWVPVTVPAVRSKECGCTGLGGMPIAITDPATPISQSDGKMVWRSKLSPETVLLATMISEPDPPK